MDTDNSRIGSLRKTCICESKSSFFAALSNCACAILNGFSCSVTLAPPFYKNPGYYSSRSNGKQPAAGLG